MINIHSLIIGGTKGTGKTIAKTLAGENHIISAIGRNPPESEKNISYLKADVADKKQLSLVLKKILNQNGKINNLIFCQRSRSKENIWQNELEISLTATKYII